jgi:uncharacterized protein
MNGTPLSEGELGLMQGVFSRFSAVEGAVLFGSRAKGTHTVRSDVDIVIMGEVDSLGAEAIGAELDMLPLPYRFGVLAGREVDNAALLDHVARVGVVIYRRETGRA